MINFDKCFVFTLQEHVFWYSMSYLICVSFVKLIHCALQIAFLR